MKYTNTFGATLDLSVGRPTIQAHDFGWQDLTDTLTWVRGNGNKVIIFISVASEVEFLPFDYTTYIVGNSYGGDEVAYKGSESSVVLTGLVDGIEYHVRAFEYNGFAGLERYLLDEAAFNPYSFIPGTTLDGARLLEDGEYRLLEDGEVRLLE